MAEPARYPRDIPPLWLLGSLVAMAGLHWLLPGRVLFGPARAWAGWAIVAAAVLLDVWAAGLFARARTGIVPFREATVLVAWGPYRVTRNPMYVGMAGVLAGAAVLFGTLTPWLVLPVFVAVIDRRFVRREERFLRERFGAGYDAYRARVRRWL